MSSFDFLRGLALLTDRQADHIEDTSGATDQGRELVPPTNPMKALTQSLEQELASVFQWMDRKEHAARLENERRESDAAFLADEKHIPFTSPTSTQQDVFVFTNIRGCCLRVRRQQVCEKRRTSNEAMGRRIIPRLQKRTADRLCVNCINQLWAELEAELKLLHVLRARKREWNYLRKVFVELHRINFDVVASVLKRNHMLGWLPTGAELQRQELVAYHEYHDQRLFILKNLLPTLKTVISTSAGNATSSGEAVSSTSAGNEISSGEDVSSTSETILVSLVKKELDRLEVQITTATNIGWLAEVKETLSQLYDPSDSDLNEELSSLTDMCNTRLHMLAYGPVSPTSSTSSGEDVSSTSSTSETISVSSTSAGNATSSGEAVSSTGPDTGPLDLPAYLAYLQTAIPSAAHSESLADWAEFLRQSHDMDPELNQWLTDLISMCHARQRQLLVLHADKTDSLCTDEEWDTLMDFYRDIRWTQKNWKMPCPVSKQTLETLLVQSQEAWSIGYDKRPSRVTWEEYLANRKESAHTVAIEDFLSSLLAKFDEVPS